jgi:HEAT repeat protein
VTALTRALKDKDEDVRGEAAAALGHIGAEAKSAVGDLVELLKDEHRAVRRQAATALQMIDPETAARHLGFLPRLRRWFERSRPEKPR